MSVAMALAMDSTYGLRLGVVSHHRHGACLPGSSNSNEHRGERGEDANEQMRETPLRFSVLNILRPDFGREAILSTKVVTRKQPVLPIAHAQLPPRLPPRHSPVSSLPSPRDFSAGTSVPRDVTRLSPRSPAPTNYTNSNGTSSNNSIAHHHRSRDGELLSARNALTPPLNSHSLSRSGSLESLSSNRSSLTGSSVTGAPSLSSAASTIGTESISGDSTTGSAGATGNGNVTQTGTNAQSLWPAWVYCTRYSDRPSSGPRTRRVKRSSTGDKTSSPEEKRPRTAFSAEQLARLKQEFAENRYLTERRRQQLSRDLGLNEAQIKIWFQNKRAKIKKSTGQKNPLALQLMAQGLYNHSTVPVDEDGEELTSPVERSTTH